MKRPEQGDPPWGSSSQFDKPPASSFGEVAGRTAGWLNRIFRSLPPFLPIHHMAPDLIVAVVLGLGFLAWMLIEQPFYVPPLTSVDQAMLARQQKWQLQVNEDFSGPADGASNMEWEGIDETDYHFVERWVEDGQWRWSGDFDKAENCCRGFSAWLFPQEVPANFWLSVDFTWLEGDARGNFNVIYHYQDMDNFYIANINDIGNGGINVWGSGKWEALLTPGPEPARSYIHPDENNTFQISVEDGKAVIIINGQYFGQYTDTRVPTGQLGIVVPKPYDGGHIEMAIDNIQLRWR